MEYILAYRFNEGVRYWSEIYAWTPNLDDATRYDEETARTEASTVGAFVLGIEEGEVVDV